MNMNSEQVRPDLSLDMAQDQVLSPKQQQEAMIRFLGDKHCKIQEVAGKRVFTYFANGKTYILLHMAVTYLGNPHPTFKKRVQLPHWYKEFCDYIKINNLEYDVRFIGVYHYEGLVIFIDFVKDTYLKKIVHNSSAHIYINDLFQALTNGVFHKEDMFGNHIYAIRGNKFASYLCGTETGQNVLFSLFEQFNQGFTFGQWLKVLPTVKEMEKDKWPEWRQTEWPGWYLEYRFNRFTIEKCTSPYIIYTGQSNKSKQTNAFDFDIWFKKAQFYGDLKASDIAVTEAPGNDQTTFIECINMFGKFWYVIYEHETKKDSEDSGYQYVRAYNRYMKKDELSYAKRLKIGVRFIRMTILELNRINFREALSEFNQGHQPDGSARNPKFMIKKKDIDRFVVFRYKFSTK